MSWAEDVVSGLLYLRGRGFDFERAFAEVLAEYPPERRELGLSRGESATFEQLAEEQAAMAWFENVCRRAWFDAPRPDGSPSMLARLGPLEEALLVAAGSPRRGRSRPASLQAA